MREIIAAGLVFAIAVAVLVFLWPAPKCDGSQNSVKIGDVVLLAGCP
jgi:hypothetical protein